MCSFGTSFLDPINLLSFLTVKTKIDFSEIFIHKMNYAFLWNPKVSNGFELMFIANFATTFARLILKYTVFDEKQERLSNLYLNMLNRLDVNIESFSDSTGKLSTSIL